ncbi:Syndecan-like protein [Leptotrombidium deliense]|uniref:Syndecan n=1 Tax=Leptotrombidium deliense TaxID=299467 RepID=A0A443SQI4_9ACAR|nr:Syndecan-like protein [Leptotrombidium deliense]
MKAVDIILTTMMKKDLEEPRKNSKEAKENDIFNKKTNFHNVPDSTETSTKFTIATTPKSKETSNTVDSNNQRNDVSILGRKQESKHFSFFTEPGILAAVIGGAVVGLLCAILLVMFIVYRMRKKDEGSYALDEPKMSPAANPYAKGNSREFYA